MVFCNKTAINEYKYLVEVTILILIDGFLQYVYNRVYFTKNKVTILILIDGFLQSKNVKMKVLRSAVTILILIDGFLQFSSRICREY